MILRVHVCLLFTGGSLILHVCFSRLLVLLDVGFLLVVVFDWISVLLGSLRILSFLLPLILASVFVFFKCPVLG